MERGLGGEVAGNLFMKIAGATLMIALCPCIIFIFIEMGMLFRLHSITFFQYQTD